MWRSDHFLLNFIWIGLLVVKPLFSSLYLERCFGLKMKLLKRDWLAMKAGASNLVVWFYGISYGFFCCLSRSVRRLLLEETRTEEKFIFCLVLDLSRSSAITRSPELARLLVMGVMCMVEGSVRRTFGSFHLTSFVNKTCLVFRRLVRPTDVAGVALCSMTTEFWVFGVVTFLEYISWLTSRGTG